MSHLVIVESPAKAKTIGQYLGKDYRVTATMGHIRDLPKSGIGVDVNAGFVINYEPIQGKEETIGKLREAAKSSDSVILATDPDREGEAISWHLKELLELSDGEVKRVTFNAITKNEVLKSISNPRGIDYPLVDAQQARRVLDRLVGYEISPILWRKIKSGLSAGRVQSVSVRMVVDRENEIRAFKPEEYWSIEAKLNRTEGAGSFTAQYHAPVGEKKAELHSIEAVNGIINAVQSDPFSVASVTHTEKKRSPAPPFTTSTLQQEASRKLGMSPKRTMSIAQQLYEGVEIEGHGLTGLITYMRTDSVRLSDEAVNDARGFIKARYGQDYLPKAPRAYKAKKEAQDAHEAIRPSYIELPPEIVAKSLKPEQAKLYKLIWDRFISCQMIDARFDLLTIDCESAGHIFRANRTTLIFPGFTAVYEETRDSEEAKAENALPFLREGEGLRLDGITPEQHFTKPPARYSEATLIRAMEEQGIGRPSTYAPTISTIIDREYVLLEQRQLRPTPLGEVVTDYMRDKFSDIVDIAFTAGMESQLDDVEQGSKDWRVMLREFYNGFEVSKKGAEQDLQNGRLRIPDEQTDEVCEVCGRPIVIKMGRFGRYMACSGYPKECTVTRPLSEPTDGVCPLCSCRILKKKSKRGYSYYGCEKNPSCGFMSWDIPLKDICEQCGKTMFRVKYKKVPICENPSCPDFVPEDQRGYKKKAEASSANADEKTKKTPSAKTSAKKAPAKSAAKTTKKSTKTTKKPAANAKKPSTGAKKP